MGDNTRCKILIFGSVAVGKSSIVRDAQPRKPAILIGKKCDLENDRVISKEQGIAVANELSGGRMGYQDISAKNGDNVTEVFHEIVRMIVKENNSCRPKETKKRCLIL